MVKLTFEPEITIELFQDTKVAVIKIQDTEFERITFDTYENDNYSVVFYICGRDAVNIDYDVLRVW